MKKFYIPEKIYKFLHKNTLETKNKAKLKKEGSISKDFFLAEVKKFCPGTVPGQNFPGHCQDRTSPGQAWLKYRSRFPNITSSI